MKHVLVCLVLFSFAFFIGGCDDPARPLPNSSESSQNAKSAGNPESEIQPLELIREDFDKDKPKFQKDAKSRGSKVGIGANDLWFWAKLIDKFSGNAGFIASEVTIDVDSDIVTLKGTAVSQAVKEDIVKTAQSLEGVKEVVDQLKVDLEKQ